MKAPCLLKVDTKTSVRPYAMNFLFIYLLFNLREDGRIDLDCAIRIIIRRRRKGKKP